ncbi:MAG: hypothetical protein LBR41_02165, partial [Rickettsiales bacterium]|nr:hypothetical protein [Rickettsiales bacterium]
MKILKNKLSISILATCYLLIATYSAQSAELNLDTTDPLWFNEQWGVLSQTTVYAGDPFIGIGERVTVGLSDRFLVGADINYRWNTDPGQPDGFDGFGLDAAYRTGLFPAAMTDVLFGIKFAGTADVPEFSNNRYMLGFRVGKQYERMTFAGTAKTTWVFDNAHGMAYIDFIPEAYFRISETWTAGAHADLRKSTIPDFDRQWLGANVAKR